MTKGSRFLAASMAAVSMTAAISPACHPSTLSCNCNFSISLHNQEVGSGRDHDDSSSQSNASASSLQLADPTDNFAPSFDGLRFIETLITAHR